MRNAVPLTYITTWDLRKWKSMAVLVIWRAVNHSSTLGDMSALTIDESYHSFFYLITGAGFWLKYHLICFRFGELRCRPQMTPAQLSSLENKQLIDQKMCWEPFSALSSPPMGPAAGQTEGLSPSSGVTQRFEDRQCREFVFSSPASAPQSTHSRQLWGEHRHLQKLTGDSRMSSKGSQVGIWSLHFAFRKQGSKVGCAGALTLLGRERLPRWAVLCSPPSHHASNTGALLLWGSSSKMQQDLGTIHTSVDLFFLFPHLYSVSYFFHTSQHCECLRTKGLLNQF